MSDLWSVTVPGYLTGFGTVALVAVTAATITRDRRRDARRSVSEARKVFATAEHRSGASTDATTGQTTTYENDALVATNASADPIFNVSCWYEPTAPIEGATRLEFQMGVHQGTFRYVLPGTTDHMNGTWITTGPDIQGFQRAEMLYWSYQTLAITISWTDNLGQQWIREGIGEPSHA